MVYSSILGIGPRFSTKEQAEKYNKLKYNGKHQIMPVETYEDADFAYQMTKNIDVYEEQKCHNQ